MPRYTLTSVGEAVRQYTNLPEDTRRLVDRRIEELLEDPTGNSHKQHDEQHDRYTIPIGDDKGFIVYAIVKNARLVILLRFTPGLD